VVTVKSRRHYNNWNKKNKKTGIDSCIQKLGRSKCEAGGWNSMKLQQNWVTGYTNFFSNLLTSQVSVNLTSKIFRQECHICLSNGDKWADFFYSMYEFFDSMSNTPVTSQVMW
jgi:hypothetical protein